MSRHLISRAIVLHQQPIGESHAELALLCDGHGLIKAKAHGIQGQRSPLRAKCQTYAMIDAYLFEDSQKQRWRLSDAETVADFFGLRENLMSLYHAAAVAEILVQTPCEAHENWAFPLCLLSLEALDAARVTDAPQHVCLQFLWRYLGFTGFQPDTRHCALTGSALEASQAVAWQNQGGGFVAAHHPDVPAGGLEIPPAALAYLRHSMDLDFAAACRIGLEPASRVLLSRLLFQLVQQLLGRKLAVLNGQEWLFYR